MALIGQLWAIPVPDDDDDDDDGKSLFYKSILQLVNWDKLFVMLIAYFSASQINRVLIWPLDDYFMTNFISSNKTSRV